MGFKMKIMMGIGRLAHILRQCEDLYSLQEVRRKSGSNFFYVSQGTGGLSIGSPENLQMDATSHFKSGAFVECRGG